MSSVSPSRSVIPRLRSRVQLARSLVLALGFCLLLNPIAAHARGPEPALRIPLQALGFNTVSSRYLLDGATMLTVNYVDKDHLLVTFGVSRLMKRLPDCPPEDEDRLVKAVLLELPTAKVLAETEWRFHDLGQYLWDLGGGTFMLRQREVLTTFTPLDGLASGGTFELHPFLKFDRRIEAIVVSAGHDLISIETVKKTPPKVENASILVPGNSPSSSQSPSPSPSPSSSQSPSSSPSSNTRGLVLQRRDQPPDQDQQADQEAAKADPAPVEITFVRLTHRAGDSGPGGPDHIVATAAGRVRTKTAVYLPLTTDGFLETKGVTRDGVLFDFLTFTGKQIELGDFATSCTPKPTFVSPSEFVAFGCRGSDDSQDLAGFNLRGDLIWQMNFSDIHAYPSIVAAIPAGRFALSRTLTLSNIFGSETPSMDQLTGQEVRVVQMYNGRQLLKVMTSPIQRAGQNFALSPDGMALAIVHDNTTVRSSGSGEDAVRDTLHDPAIEIYKLPPLSPKDQKEIAAEAALAPEPANARMRFSLEEIKAALVKKPGAASDDNSDAEDTAESRRASKADARIVGDPPPLAANTGAQSAPDTGSIPSSVAPPICADPNDKQATGCPVKPQPRPADTPGTANTSDEIAPDRPRKPPTLYSPGEAHEPVPNGSPQPQ